MDFIQELTLNDVFAIIARPVALSCSHGGSSQSSKKKSFTRQRDEVHSPVYRMTLLPHDTRIAQGKDVCNPDGRLDWFKLL